MKPSAVAPQIEDWRSCHEEPPQKDSFWGGGFNEVKDGVGCNAKHCGRGGIFKQLA